MNTWRRLLYTLVLLAVISLPLGCGSPEAVPTPIPTLEDRPPSTPTVEPTSTPAPPHAPRLLEQIPAVGQELQVDEPLELVFDQPMDAASVEAAFEVTPDVPGNFEWPSPDVLRFVPEPGSLTRAAEYRISIDTAARSRQGLGLAREVTFRQRIAGFIEVSNVFPQSGSAEVAPTAELIVTFNRPIVPLTGIDDAASLPAPLGLSPAVPGQGSWTNTSIYTFIPFEPLAAGQTYTATVPAGLSFAGAVLEEPYTWSFTVAPPSVALVTPLPEATLVDPRTDIVLEFGQAMDRDSVSERFEVTRVEDGTPVAGRIDWDGSILRYRPEQPLERAEAYQVTLSAGAMVATGATGMEREQGWAFEVAPLPRVLGITPRDGAGDVELYGSLQIAFSAPMDAAATAAALTITPTVRTYPYWPYDQNELWVSWTLKPSTRYTVTLSTEATDRFGVPLQEPVTWTFESRALEPSISLLTEGPVGVYSTYTDAVIAIQHVNVPRIALELYEVTPEQLVLLTREGGWPDWDSFRVRGEDRVAAWTLDASAPLNAREVLREPLPGIGNQPLAAGIYVLIANAPGVARPERHAFVVTPMSVTLKTSEQEALIWVTDLRSGLPLEDIEVALYDNGGSLTAEGRSDADGLALLDMPQQERWESVTVIATGDNGLGAVVSNWTEGISPWEYDLVVAWETTEYRGHLFTERRIYRPGQQVFFKAFIRGDDDGQYALPPAGLGIEAIVVDSQGRTIWADDVGLSETGSLDGAITLAESASLGLYSLVLRFEDQFLETSFQVAEYRVPEFQVTVATDDTEYISGQEMRVDIDAAFFFGGPVSGADVQWRVFGDPYYFDRWTGTLPYSFGSHDLAEPGVEIADVGLLTEGLGETDENGHMSFAVPTALQSNGSRRFTIQVSVVDINQQEVTGQTAAIVHRGGLYVGLATDRYVVTSGEAMQVDLLSVDTQGEALPERAINVVVSRQESYSVQEQTEDGTYLWRNEIRDVRVHTESVRTDAQGRARMAWTPAEGGTYRVLASARDERRNQVQSTLYLWVSGTAFVNWGRENNYRINLVADRAQYAPGDVASILVPSPYEGAVTALLTIERGRILEYRVIELAGNSERVEIPIEPAYAPNVFVSVVLIRGMGGDDNEPGYRVGMVMLPVSTQERELTVSISPDQTTAYQPGDTAAFELKTTDSDGRPVSAEVALQLVDLAVESLIGGAPTIILEAFYRERGLGVNTALSLVRRRLPEEETEGNEGKGGGGGDGSADVLRTEFPETALWEPVVQTDGRGEATVSVMLPDNLTTWRLTAQAATEDTRVGTGHADIVTNLDVMIQPAVPRFLVIGDAPRLSAVVHNNTDDGLEIRVTLDGEGITLTDREQVVVLDAGTRTALYWPATVDATDQATLTFTAEGGPFRDATRIAIPVYHASTPEVVGTSGVVDESITEVIRVPAAANAEQGGLTVRLEPSLAAAMQKGLEYLETYPYGCIEQTVSRVLPNLVTYRSLAALGMEDPKLAAALSQQIAVALQRIYALQNLDGGWGWWGNESSPVISAYAVFGLAQAQASGYLVDTFVFERAVDYLYGYLSGDRPVTRDDYDTRAAVLYALAEAKQGDLGRSTALFEERENLSLFAKGYLAMTLYLLEPEEGTRVATLEDELVQAGILSSTGLHWEEDTPTLWQMNTNTRTTAIVLRALTWIAPDNSLLPQAVRWLTMARSSGRWESTQENVWAILALTDYMVSTGELEADYAYELTIDGEERISGQAERDTLSEPVSTTVPMAELQQGIDTYLTLSREPAQGPGRLYYSAFMQYLLPVDQIEPLDRGIIVYREYHAEGRPGRPVTSARVGDMLTVKLTLVAPYDLYYLVVEDPLPAGCEALDPTLATTRRLEEDALALMPDRGDIGDAWWKTSWPTHTEIRDEKVALFADNLPRGTYEYTYQVRCTTVGDYLVIPAQAYQMYAPDVLGRTGGLTFTVRP